jgi:acetolactate synthase-1/2/3 large subunit
MNAAEYLTRLLALHGVDCVFGIPGVHTLELYRALDSVSIRHVTPRHEQAAGFMADGLARCSGKPGVCFIISGPGMTNILTAIGQAYADSIPMLVISTVNAHGHMGSGDGWLHELPDQQALVRGVCAFSHTIHRAHEIPQVLARAFAVFDSARPRPVHIELPLNVLASDMTLALPDIVLRLARPSVNPLAARSAAQWLQTAITPLILAGGGAIAASSPLRKLAERLDAPVVMTVNARGILGSDHPLAVGASASLACVRALIESADTVLAVGTEFGSTDYDFNEDGNFHIPGKLIRIDIDPQQLVRTRIPELGLVGDAAQGIRALLECLPAEPVPQGTGSARALACNRQVVAALNTRETRYLQLLKDIRDCLPRVTIVGDSTQIIYTGNSTYAAAEPSSYFNSATGFGTLGYALPAAIGVAVADPARPVVAISGDGGLQFCLGELATAADTGSRLTLIVHRNGGYAEISKFMLVNDVTPVGVDLLVPDFLALASACGWRCRSLESLDDLSADLSEAQLSDRPTLLLVDDALFD